MMPKILSPKQHGVADWGLAAGLVALPKLLNVNPTAQKLYCALGLNILSINGTTDHGVGVAPLISIETHKKLDLANLALLYGMFSSKIVTGDKETRNFHIGLTALATLNVLTTDYKKNTNE